MRHEPSASRTAAEAKFSEAMSSRPSRCRTASASMSAATSASCSASNGVDATGLLVPDAWTVIEAPIARREVTAAVAVGGVVMYAAATVMNAVS